MPVNLYTVMMFAFSILFVQDFNIVLVFTSFYINSFSFLFSFISGFFSSSRSRFRERLPNHFRSSFSFVHENNTGPYPQMWPCLQLCVGYVPMAINQHLLVALLYSVSDHGLKTKLVSIVNQWPYLAYLTKKDKPICFMVVMDPRSIL